MAGNAIEARGVGKRFQLYSQRATSLKERVLGARSMSGQDFWALREVDLSIDHGETVGLIGPNGSGKSTLLKVLSGILPPTNGTVMTKGRVASLLELGAGFDGELTGRENVYLNASILGLSKRETNRYFDAIVDFSELGRFIDTQVKHYSSGMYVRLGFAVAVHVDPDILLVDEVLAVGDEAFARKCLAKVAEFQREGRTILFVSHGLDTLDQICTRGVVLNHGRVMFDGEIGEATGRLRALLGTAGSAVDTEQESGILRILDARCADPVTRVPEMDFYAGDKVAIEVDVRALPGAPPAVTRVIVTGPSDYPLYTLESGTITFDPSAEHQTVRMTMPSLPSLQGLFSLAVALVEPTSHQALDVRRFGERLRVYGPSDGPMVVVEYDTDVLDTPAPPALPAPPATVDGDEEPGRPGAPTAFLRRRAARLAAADAARKAEASKTEASKTEAGKADGRKTEVGKASGKAGAGRTDVGANGAAGAAGEQRGDGRAPQSVGRETGERG
jgi:ABC-2 type transport system ATP-binding protein